MRLGLRISELMKQNHRPHQGHRIPEAELLREAHAHCDGPCGIYDPASARIAAEAALSMTHKLGELAFPEAGDPQAMAAYQNTVSRFVAIKEEQAELAKHELLVLWTDFFKPEHIEANPDLHETFWQAAKLCSHVKQNVDEAAAKELLAAIEKVHAMFWGAKSRDVDFYLAG